MSVDRDRLAQLRELFPRRFGREPAIFSRAPGRVELMGSHTDYNLGRVLTLPVSLDTWIVASPRHDGTVHAVSVNLDREVTFSLDAIERRGDWADYLRGTARMLQRAGLIVSGADLIIDSTIPIGGGLSSSAALECAAAALWKALGSWQLDPIEMAQLCQRAENEFVGVNCGILDQFSSCVDGHGGALLLDCRTTTAASVGVADGLAIVVCDTRVARDLATSDYGARRRECEESARLLGVGALSEIGAAALPAAESRLPAHLARRTRFIVEESDRVGRFAAALTAGDRVAIARVMAASFKGACELFEIGVPSMVAMMTAMSAAPGFIGGRQSGAGFGGCLVAIVEQHDVNEFIAAVSGNYERATHVAPKIYQVTAGRPAEAFASRHGPTLP